MKEDKKELDAYKIVELIILALTVVAFQILTSLGLFGLPPVAIAIVPITLGAVIYGFEGAILLGTVYGITSIITGLTFDQTYFGAFFDTNWIAVSVSFLLKGVAAGVIAALIFKGLKNINRYMAMAISSIAAPVVNTVVVLLTTPFYISTIEEVGAIKNYEFVDFVVNAIILEGFLPELLVNILLVVLLMKPMMYFRHVYKRRKRILKRNDKYLTVFFDLDGTVADSGEGVTNSVIYALDKFGIKETVKNTKRFIGPPLAHSFRNFYGFDDEKTDLAIKYYREYYKEKGIYECYLYDGMRELLSGLKRRHYKVVLCTSKPENYAKTVLEYLEVDKYFDVICGATMDEKTRTTKEEVMSYAMMMAHTSPSTTVMIGDRLYDVCSANYFGIDSIGVTFGYGSRDELKKAKATMIVDSCEEIKKILF